MPAIRRVTPWFLIVLSVYAVAMYSGMTLRSPVAEVAVFWPAAGIGAGLVALGAAAGRRVAAAAVLGIMAANLLVNAAGGHDPMSVLGFSAANTAESLAAGAVLASMVGNRGRQAAATAARVLLGGVVGVLVSTPFAVVLLSGSVAAPVWKLALNWAVPDLAGIICIAPLLALPGHGVPGHGVPGHGVPGHGVPGRRLERAGQALVLAVLATAAFWQTSHTPIAWLPIPALVWSALRLGVTWTAVGGAAVAFASASSAAYGHGPFAPMPGDEHAALLLLLAGQAFAATAAFTSTTLAMVVRERDQLLHDASMFDPLTGVANRRLLEARAVGLSSDSPHTRSWGAVLYCDLNDFKQVNSTLGHAGGDLLLQVVAGRIVEAVRPGDTVARVGGDEFAVLCPRVDGPEQAEAIRARIEDLVAEPHTVDGHKVAPSVTVGVALTDSPRPFAELLDEADRAMYARKERRQHDRLHARWAGRRGAPPAGPHDHRRPVLPRQV